MCRHHWLTTRSSPCSPHPQRLERSESARERRIALYIKNKLKSDQTSTSTSAWLSICMSVRLRVCPSACLSVCIYGSLLVCPSVLCTFVSVCVCVRDLIQLFVCLRPYLSVCVWPYLFVFMSVTVSICLFVSDPIHLFVCDPIHLFVCLWPIHLFVCLSPYLSVCRSVTCLYAFTHVCYKYGCCTLYREKHRKYDVHVYKNTK